MFRAQRLLAAAALVIAAVGTTACATYSAPYRYPARVDPVDDRAYQIGYAEGRERGVDDVRRRRNYDYDRHRAFRNADLGYRGYGSRSAYRDVFRQGFIAGYNDGYRRYGGGGYGSPGIGRGPAYPGPNARFVSPAAQTGYRDGYEQGRDDRRDGDRFDPVRASRYRSADHDYDRRYGSLDEYKRDYRAAFQQGYSDGYYGR